MPEVKVFASVDELATSERRVRFDARRRGRALVAMMGTMSIGSHDAVFAAASALGYLCGRYIKGQWERDAAFGNAMVAIEPFFMRAFDAARRDAQRARGG